nr:hypothetical protein [uncultured Flavobacterium sp.]
MLVEILKDIFKDDSNILLLNEIYFQFGDKHKLLMRDDEDIEALMESKWYDRLDPFYKETIYKAIVWSMNNSSKEPKCIISSINNDFFNLKEAIKFLEQPFVIVIENRKYDAPFFNSLLKHFPKQSKTISKFKDEKWLKYGMGGGTSVSQDIDAELDTFDNEVFTKMKYKYLRYFVIIDSDRRYPEMDLGSDKKELIKKLDENKIPYHILEKREIENYLPDEAFEEITDNEDFINEYLKLSPLQRDYFDLELGFGSKRNFYISFENLSDEEQILFSNLTDYQKDIFRNNILIKFNNSQRNNFKEDFPKLFLSSKVNRINLLKRCQHHLDENEIDNHPFDKNELPNLLKRINNLL